MILKNRRLIFLSFLTLWFSSNTWAGGDQYLKTNHQGVEAYASEDYDLAAKKFNQAIQEAKKQGVEDRKIQKLEANLRLVEYIQENGFEPDLEDCGKNCEPKEASTETKGSTRKAKAQPPVEDLSLKGTLFGSFREIKKGRLSFTESKEIPSTPTTNYSWVLVFNQKTLKPHSIREVFSMPTAPKHYPRSGNVQVSDDGLIMTSLRDLKAGTKIRTGFWFMDAGDPLGPQKMEIYLEEKLVGSFDFTVKKKVQFTEPEEITLFGQPIQFGFAPDQKEKLFKKK